MATWAYVHSHSAASVAAMEPGTGVGWGGDGEWRGSTAMLAVWRQGGAQYAVVRSFGAVTSCIEVRDGRGEIEMG